MRAARRGGDVAIELGEARGQPAASSLEVVTPIQYILSMHLLIYQYDSSPVILTVAYGT